MDRLCPSPHLHLSLPSTQKLPRCKEKYLNLSKLYFKLLGKIVRDLLSFDDQVQTRALYGYQVSKGRDEHDC